jgi:hypothetical protein
VKCYVTRHASYAVPKMDPLDLHPSSKRTPLTPPSFLSRYFLRVRTVLFIPHTPPCPALMCLPESPINTNASYFFTPALRSGLIFLGLPGAWVSGPNPRLNPPASPVGVPGTGLPNRGATGVPAGAPKVKPPLGGAVVGVVVVAT